MRIATAIRLGFKKRQFLYSSVLLFSAAYALSPPSLVVRLALLAAVGVTADLTFTFFATALIVPPLRLYLMGKKPEPTEVSEIREVATKAGVRLPERAFSLTDEDVPAATNAYTRKMVLNRALLEQLTPDERRFVGGHEVTHITGQARSLATLMAFGIGAAMAAALPLAFLGLPALFTYLPAFTAMIIAAGFAQRREELRADLGGARFVPFETARSALLKVYGERGMDSASDTHPSGNIRLRNLRNYYDSLERQK